MLKSLISKWKSCKKYKTFSEMPDWLVAFFAISGFLIAGFYSYVLGKVVPEFRNSKQSSVESMGLARLASVCHLGCVGVHGMALWFYFLALQRNSS
ncbi:MAG: hypothetical protein LDL14_04215 [Nitrospira sp.]|nr:hypothetical protein [Nitrospira sp.]